MSNLTLTAKLLLTFVPLFLVAVGGIYYFSSTSAEEQMFEQAKAAALQKAHIVREALVSQMVDRYRVEDAFLNRIRTAGGLKELYIRIRPKNLQLMEDLEDDTTRPQRLWKRVQFAMTKGDLGNEVFDTGIPIWVRRPDDLEAIIPFKAEKKCQACHEVPLNHVLGVAHIQVPLTEIQESISENSNQLAMISIVLGIVTLAIGFAFYRGLVRKPVQELVKATEAMGQGDMGYETKVLESRDELGQLSRSFDRMRKALQQSQAALRTSTVGQIAESLIRDFRAPIRQILGSVGQIEREGMEESQRKNAAETVRNAVQQMNKMTQDVLDFTTGEMRVNKMSSNVPSLVNYVREAVTADLEKDMVRFDVQQGFSGNASLDYERIARALINIALYSANYVPPGGTIRLSTESEGGWLIFKVSNDGSAIPEQFRERIFEPFMKIVQEKGVGLGLALAKRIVEMQGGNVGVESKEGGTVFRVGIPLS
ncbi:MAG: HAMP domain-containing histidine kinase [Ignavibacteriales bacterium]|nr:HAMP domain-containing histidine kinase [Ignavibacteriales bacterium]